MADLSSVQIPPPVNNKALMIGGAIVVILLIILIAAAALGAFKSSSSSTSTSSSSDSTDASSSGSADQTDERTSQTPYGSDVSNESQETSNDVPEEPEPESEPVESEPVDSEPESEPVEPEPVAPEPVAYPTTGAVFAMKGLGLMPPLFQNSTEDRAVGIQKSASAGLRPAYLTNTSALGKQRNIRMHAKGYEIASTPTEMDLAAGRGNRTRQSGTRDDKYASYAVDGNADTFQQTAQKQTGWWEIDLPALSSINKIVITNSKSNKDRLRDIVVYIYNGDVEAYKSDVLNAKNALKSPATLEVVPTAPVIGNRVRIMRNPDKKSDVEGYVLNMANVSVMGVTAPCSDASTEMNCVIQKSINNSLGDLFDVSTGKSQRFFEQIEMFITTGIKWLDILSKTANDTKVRPQFAERSNTLNTRWEAWKAQYNSPNTILFVPDHLLASLEEINGYLAGPRATVNAGKKPAGGDGDRASAYFWNLPYGDPNDPVTKVLSQTTFSNISTAGKTASDLTQEFARSVLFENEFGCARRRPRLDYVRDKNAKAAQPVQYVSVAPGDRQLCVTSQTAPDMTDYEAMTYMTTYMDVEVMNLNDRAKNIATAKTHWRTTGLPTGLVKNNFFFAKAANTLSNDSKKWIATDRTFTIPGVKPIADVLKTRDMANTMLLTFYENMRDILRVRLNTIYNWMRQAINFAGDVYNKQTMSTDEANTARENFRKAMVLLYGTSVTIDKIGTLPQIIKDKKAPAIPEPVEINGIVANYLFMNGQWYAFSLNALAPYGYMDTRTSRMIFVCSSSSSAAVACRTSDDRICDFVTTGLPTDINKSACDPNTIYGAYMILYVFTNSLDAEYKRQIDPYKKQKLNKAAKKFRCYHKDADGKSSKCTSDGYGMCDTYTKGKKCKSGYYAKGTRCRAKMKSGPCKGKSKISSSISTWIERLSAPITLAALEDDITMDEVVDGTPVEPDPSEAYVPGVDEDGDASGTGAV